jgi:desulfoferrodoxin (superoxide reductase-like protein)
MKNEQETRELQELVISGEQDINNTLTGSKAVGPVFHTHWIELETGKNGIENLIVKILTEAQATFSKGIESSEYRVIAISQSLFASDVIAEVQKRFSIGSIRYPYNTIHQYLSIFMFRKGKVGKIKLTNQEDQDRECCKPRTKWYLIA